MALAHFLVGHELNGRYRLETVLGEGGFGVVFRASDLQRGRDVAVKVLDPPRGMTPVQVARLRQRFVHEAEVAARLPLHPNLLRVLDFGSTERLDFLVMELLHGESLRERLARPEPIPLRSALHLLRDAARGVAAGHENRLVHLDLKPANIFLEQAGEADPHVRILDFGIAKMLDATDDETRTHPALPGEWFGSEFYSAPEQLRGEPVTPANDVYSLGVVAFEVLTRTRLFSKEDMGRRRNRIPVPIPSLTARNPNVPRDVEVIIRRALDYDPSVRYADAGALATELHRALSRPFPSAALPWDDAAPAVGAPADATAVAGVGAEADATGAHWRDEDITVPRADAEVRVAERQARAVFEDGVAYTVWYATNRRPRVKSGEISGYGPRIDTKVHRGRCEVFVPRSHMIGSLGSSWWKRLVSATDDRLRLRAVCRLDPAPFWAEIRATLDRLAPDERNAVLFIHGYNVSFEAAALRTAQLGFDLNLPGPIAFFSWPSRAGLLGYLMDGAMVEASEGALAQFLVDFAGNSGAERVHVIAHSMGNRGLLRATERIIARAAVDSAVRFTHLILAAPDVTRKLFLELAVNYHRLASRTTLYISDRDRALRISRFLQGDRVGFAPPVTTCPGVDSIHVANVDATFMGHSPFAESRPVLNDIHELIRHDSPPERRMGLREVSLPGDERYWEIMR